MTTLDNECAPYSLWDAEPGTHLCALYRGEAELEQTAAAFVGSGLAAGDRVLYVASDRPAPQVRTSLEVHQVPTGLATDCGHLVIRDFADVYGEPGQLDLVQMEADFRAAARQARADGFGALRVAAEMGNFADAIGSVERLLDWERLCTPIQREEGITSVCQYDQRWFSDPGWPPGPGSGWTSRAWSTRRRPRWAWCTRPSPSCRATAPSWWRARPTSCAGSSTWPVSPIPG